MINNPVSHLTFPVSYSPISNAYDYDSDFFALHVAPRAAIALLHPIVVALAFQSSATPQAPADRRARVGFLGWAKGIVCQVLRFVPLLLGTAAGYNLSEAVDGGADAAERGRVHA